MNIQKCTPDLLRLAFPVFAGWEETMIWSCLQGVMGSVYIPAGPSPVSAAAILNDFCFLAGEPSGELAALARSLARETGYCLAVPQHPGWIPVMDAVYGERRRWTERYAIRKDPRCFDPEKLAVLAGSLPSPLSIRRIDRELYIQCRNTPWCRDLIAGFPTWEDYSRLGIGCVVTDHGIIAAGASSYSRYREGIEIEIDTKPEYRRKGLATAVGAALILECLRAGLYPSWDAASRISVSLAEKLGYTFSHAYPTCELIG